MVGIILFHYFLHKNNPYSSGTYFVQPYETYVADGEIRYRQRYQLRVYGSRLASWYGYYVSGFLIAKNTITGGKPTRATTENDIIAEIHQKRFDPAKPYLISGDQFSVLYTRNLGVFYNQLLNSSFALDAKDWEHRQRIYLQSVLIAIDGLSASTDPRTTIVPIGPRQATLTQVHPGGTGSDQVYGLLYALTCLLTPLEEAPRYPLYTASAARQIIDERKEALTNIVTNYLARVRDPQTGLVVRDMHLASARDGVIRSSSFYDNIILWKTLQLAGTLGLYKISPQECDDLKQLIHATYWNEERGFYNDDVNQETFSADWLIGFPAAFFDLQNAVDLQRAERTVAYIEQSTLVKPFPIKYQEASQHAVPWFVKMIVPTYGSTAIWSYWGAEYITLLMHLYHQTDNPDYLARAKLYQHSYALKIEEDRGFAETFDEHGNFLRTNIYKSIRITGWVVQYEYAAHLIAQAEDEI